MTDLLKTLIEDPDVVAITFRQSLEPVDGRDVPIFPPTYPAPEKGRHRLDSPYNINQDKDGTLIVDIDSVQSQANRMEGGFGSAPFDALVPQYAVKAGEHEVLLTELPHRIADAAIRCTPLAERIHSAMIDYAKGRPQSLAALCPTALIYGAWDSRDTRVKIPRAVRAEIRAFDVAVFTRSAQFSGTFNAEELGLNDSEWKKASGVGLAPTPSVDAHGGVLPHGKIVHTASVLLASLRRYTGSDQSTMLPSYLLGLALVGILHAGSDYNLRSGCWLVPNGSAEWRRVRVDGSREVLAIDRVAILEELQALAAAWSRKVGVTLGGKPQVQVFDSSIAKRMLKDTGKHKEAV